MVTAGGSSRSRAGEIGMLRLVAQRVVGERFGTPVEAVRWLTALQAQDAPGALLTVALRTTSRSRDDVRRAFNDGAVVKSWPMRGTLHLVAAEDLPWMLPVLTPRVMSGARKRHEVLDITDADVERARELAVASLEGGRSLSRGELFAIWEAGGQATAGQRGYHLLWLLSQTGTVCFGPSPEGEQRIVLLAEWIRSPRTLPREEALAELALRYFRSHGPASVTDLVAWARLSLTEARGAVAAVRTHLETMGGDDAELLLDPATPERLARFRAEAKGVVLLPGFDEFVLGYRDRSAVLAPEHAEAIVPGGNGVFRPTVVVAGRVVGTWRRDRAGIQVTPFTPLTAAENKATTRAAATLP